ncbi:hypothetical protein AOQ84DRAFT_360614 [Glonium stellatum]|uniref:Uncharacterized protein n=1 Tax=Glonium stellatum TaxID=574774 RepID=A0A8E2JX75_9PEZI|nr:hypothetical protein AOQ84DRAFT_360614 [Glonium stellatum]
MSSRHTRIYLSKPRRTTRNRNLQPVVIGEEPKKQQSGRNSGDMKDEKEQAGMTDAGKADTKKKGASKSDVKNLAKKNTKSPKQKPRKKDVDTEDEEELSDIEVESEFDSEPEHTKVKVERISSPDLSSSISKRKRYQGRTETIHRGHRKRTKRSKPDIGRLYDLTSDSSDQKKDESPPPSTHTRVVRRKHGAGFATEGDSFSAAPKDTQRYQRKYIPDSLIKGGGVLETPIFAKKDQQNDEIGPAVSKDGNYGQTSGIARRSYLDLIEPWLNFQTLIHGDGRRRSVEKARNELMSVVKDLRQQEDQQVKEATANDRSNAVNKAHPVEKRD